MSILDTATPAVDTVESINMIVHGASGSGKTFFAGSGRDGGKNDLIVAIEHGTVSAARAGSKANVLNVDSWDQLLEIVEAVVNEPDRFDWVVIDSITKMQDLIWDHLIDKAVSQNPHRSRYVRQLQEYGEAQMMLRSVVERLNASKANIIYTALSDLQTDEEAREFVAPQIHGQKGMLSSWVCAQMDLVCYLSVVRVKEHIVRKFQFHKTPEVFAKDRLGLFAKPRVNLTLAKFSEELENNSESKES